MKHNWKLPPSDTYFDPILSNTPQGFELDHLEYALTFVKQFRVAIDGGAHIGTWTVALAKRFGCVLAFEPSPDTFACLTTNTKMLSNVSVLQGALSSSIGTGMVIEDPTRAGNTGSRRISKVGNTTPLLTLDSMHLQHIDFIKLDVEGDEPLALAGAVNTIIFWRPVIMVECKAFNPPRNGGPEATRLVLHDLGYKEVGGVRNDRVFVPS